ncbi:MAG: DUF6311 domain-containing protein [Desulfomonilaceae bacterium]
MNKRLSQPPVFLSIVSIGIGCAIFLYRFGFDIIDPSNINWLMLKEDLATHYLGWLFFRNEAWAFPLGKISSLMHPVGTSLVLTDSNPLLAIPLKLLSCLLPTDFQFIGPWLLACYCLQALFGYLLMTTITGDHLVRIFGSIFFVLSPPLLLRTAHDTLCSHWIILASFFQYFRDKSKTSDLRLIAGWSILLVLSAMIHPYMSFMVFILAIAFSVSYFGIDLKEKLAPLIGSTILYLLELLLVFLVIGPLGATGLCYGENGFGEYSMNLNSFWNPMGFSTFLKGLPLGPKQWEGFNYLGLGSILLMATATISLIILPRSRRIDRKKIYFIIPFVFALIGFLLLAVSNKVSYGNSSIILFSIPQFLDMPFGVFRASGRFGWPIYYAILYAGLYAFASQVARTYAILALVICLGVQIVDLKPLLYQGLGKVPKTLVTPLRDLFWENGSSRFDNILIFPPFLKNIISSGDYRYLALYAAKHGMTIDTGYVARGQDMPMSEYRKLLEKSISCGQIEPRGLYILTSFREICQLMRSGCHCYKIDSYNLCVSKPLSSESTKLLSCDEITLDNFLRKYRQHIVILAVSEKAYSNFSEETKDYLRERGSKIDQLVPGKHYVGAIIGDKVCKEAIEKDKTGSVTFHKGDFCGQPLRTDIRISQNRPSAEGLTTIECEGTECATNSYGINAIVVNENGSVVFTTSSECKLSNRVFLVSPTPKPQESQ